MDSTSLVSEVVEYIEQNLKNDISVNSISEITGLSIWHFQRIFHQALGETIGSYLRRRRLAMAAAELKNSNSKLKVIDLALDFQFGSPEAFSRSFKKEFGIAPLQYVKSNKILLPFKKPALDGKNIKYIVNDLNLEPKVEKVNDLYVVGVSARVASPLISRFEYLNSIEGVWSEFRNQENKIPKLIPKIKVGVINNLIATGTHIHDDQTEYVAGGPITEFQSYQREGLIQTSVPAGLYAIFESKGFHTQTQYLIDYVYSTWLPRASYTRDEGPEYTLLDHRFIPLNSQTSPVKYFLPIRELKK